MAIEYATNPLYIEYLDGEAHPKVSPRDAHGVLQAQLAYLLITCGARKHGRVATELDAVIGKRDGTTSKLIPDVSFARFEQYAGLSKRDIQEPPFSPAIAIEVWSPGDSREYLERKIARLLKTGSQLVLIVHPQEEKVEAHTGSGVQIFTRPSSFASELFPWFAFELDELFGVVDDLPERFR